MPDYAGTIADSFNDYAQNTLARQQLALHAQEVQQAQQKLDILHQASEREATQALYGMLSGGAKPVDQNGNVNVTAPTPTASVQSNMTTGADRLPQAGINHGLDMVNGPQTLVAANPGQTINFSGRRLEVPTQQDLVANEVSRQSALKQTDPTLISIKDSLADTLGIPRGSRVSTEHLAGLASLARSERPVDNRPTVLKTETMTDDQGNVHSWNVMSDGSAMPIQLPQGTKGKSNKYGNPEGDGLTAYEQAIQAREDVRQKGNDRAQALKDYKAALQEEAGLHDTRNRLGAALTAKTYYVDGKGAVKSFNNAGGIPMSDEEKQGFITDMKQRLQDATNRLPGVLDRKNDAMERVGTKPGVSTEQAMAAINPPRQTASLPQSAQQPTAPTPSANEAAALAGGSPQKAGSPLRAATTGASAAAPQSATTSKASVSLPSKAAALLAPGRLTKFINGQEWTLENGKPALWQAGK